MSAEEPGWRAELTDIALRSELDRLHPERVGLRPRDLAGVVAALDLVDQLWAPTIEEARRLPSAALHVRVAGEYSFLETLRHLVFVSDAWVHRMVLGSSSPMHPWGVAPNLAPDAPHDDGPDLDDVLAVRRERTAPIRAHLLTLSDDDLRVRVGGPWDGPDVPLERRARVIDCFRVVFREEWWHHQFAVRDLAALSG